MDIKKAVESIKKEMEIVVARNSVGMNIYDQVFKIEELLKVIESNHSIKGKIS